MTSANLSSEIPGGTGDRAAAILMQSRRAYTVCALDFEKNKQDVLNVWRNSGFGIPESKYSWMYEGNPHGRAIGRLVLDKNDEVVGMAALFPRGLRIDGNSQAAAAIVGDFVIAREHRSLGPALMLQKALIESQKKHHVGLVYGFPNQQAEAVLQKAGYRFIGNTIRLTRPLRSHYYLSRKISAGRLSKVLAGIVDPILHWTAKEIRYKTNSRLKSERLVDFDERFNDFWARCAFPGLIVGERNSAYLRWRYTHCLHKNYRIDAVTDGLTRDILGYVVWYAAGSSVYIAELWEDGKEGVMDCLLSEFLRFQGQHDVDSISISYLGGQALTEKLKQYGFAIRGAEKKMFVLADPTAPWFARLASPENWCLFEGDRDT